MPTFMLLLAWLLSHWTVISSVIGAALTGAVTGNWSAFFGVLITALTMIYGKPKAAAMSAHIRKRAS